MTLSTWLSLVAICCLGAISPGPSLAVVLQHTLSNSRAHGVIAGVSHALGVALWALLTVWGLALVVANSPTLSKVIMYSGAAYLAWMGVKALRSTQGAQLKVEKKQAALSTAARDGMMISLLNPKLALFFIALFSQFVSTQMGIAEKAIMISTAAVIDGLWYCLVAIILSQAQVINRLQQHSVLIDRISGLILVGLALRVVTL